MRWLLAFILLGASAALAQDMSSGLRGNTSGQLMQGGLNNTTIIASGGGGGGGTQNPLPIGMP
jgi:hypothetical protein